MAKLKDDQIRWILSLDAKGVQGELVEVSSSINKLKDENKGLQQEMKAAEKAMNEAASAMSRMEDAGKTNTKQYQYATESYHSNAAALVELKSKIDQNNKSIEEGKEKFEGLTEKLKVNDMTMNQLRQRAADLQKQLNETSQKLDKSAYNDLQKQLEKVKGRMFDVEKSGKSLLSQFASMHNPVGSAAKAIQGFGQAFDLIMKNPWAALLTVIVGAFKALKDMISNNEEAMNTLNRIMAPFKAFLDTVINSIMQLVNWILKLIETGLNSLMKWLENLPIVGKYFKEMNAEAEKAITLEKKKQELEEKHRKNIVDISKKEGEIARLREEATRKDIYSAKERIAKLEAAKDLELDILNLKKQEAQEGINIFE